MMPPIARRILTLALLSFPFASAAFAAGFDVIVVGATPAGIAAAVNAAREGVTVALVEETGHIGGLASGGLSNTDFRTFSSLGGTFREFMHRVEQYYIREYGPDSQQVIDSVMGAYYEPKVARQVFESMLNEQKRITVLLHHRLAGANVVPSGGIRRLQAADFTDLRDGGKTTLEGRMFIDATYEGDLAAAAKVPYWLGCESRY
jgi:flavin-dependent dehydrogenase